jgi:hypothetical protein
MSKLTGSCNCGAINYDVDGDVRSVVNCHCNLCRKMNGSAFSTYVAVSDDHFKLLNGDLVVHKVSEHAEKSFCGKCGTPIFNSNPKYAGLKILHFGSLDDSLNLEPKVNIYCESRLDWLGKLADITSMEQGL